jgi:hypothetical protein
MRIRLSSILLMLLLALPALALQSGCPAEYSAEQCEQIKDDPDGDGTSGGDPGSGSCPFYLCGNATGAAQSSYGLV